MKPPKQYDLGQIEGVSVRLYQSDKTVRSRPSTPQAPPILLIPGALTAAKPLFSLIQAWARQCVLGVLEVSTPDVWNGVPFNLDIAQRLAAKACDHLSTATGQPALVIGESAGAIIGLGLPQSTSAPKTALVLVDAPLAPAKPWHVRNAMQQAAEKSAPDVAAFIASYAQALFGYNIQAKGLDTDRLHYDRLFSYSAPMLLLTGDEPLWPPRTTTRVPCMLDAQDLWTLQKLKRANLTIKRIPQADHIHHRRQPEAMMQLIQDWFAEQQHS